LSALALGRAVNTLTEAAGEEEEDANLLALEAEAEAEPWGASSSSRLPPTKAERDKAEGSEERRGERCLESDPPPPPPPASAAAADPRPGADEEAEAGIDALA
jgi:hypothetical protein